MLSPVDQDKATLGPSSSDNTSEDLSLPQPSFKKELQELDEKWSVRMARLEAVLTIGHHPSPATATFSLVKVRVQHGPPAGALSQAPFLLSSVPSGQAAPASGPDGTLTTASATTSVEMTGEPLSRH